MAANAETRRYQVKTGGWPLPAVVDSRTGAIVEDRLIFPELAALIASVLNESEDPETMTAEQIEVALNARARELRYLLNNYGKDSEG